MGWWAAENGDDMIGDGPADILMDCFAAITARRQTSGDVPLTLREFLDAVTLALLREAASVGDGKRVQHLVAELRAPPDRIASSEQPAADPEIVNLLAGCLREISIEYEQMGPARKPRTSEILETISFVLGYRAPSYRDVTEGVDLAQIVAEYE